MLFTERNFVGDLDVSVQKFCVTAVDGGGLLEMEEEGENETPSICLPFRVAKLDDAFLP